MKSLNILLAEDNEADVYLVQEALRAHAIECRLHVAIDETEIERYLQRLGNAPDAPCPDIFLLDLNLLQTDGHDVLKRFSCSPSVRARPGNRCDLVRCAERSETGGTSRRKRLFPEAVKSSGVYGTGQSNQGSRSGACHVVAVNERPPRLAA